jgi:DNA-binding CsgD family transcriptional regulator
VVFGGEVRQGTLTLTEFLGTRTTGLRNLKVSSGEGAGGRAIAHRQLVAVSDYERSTGISHVYDAPVLAEGIRSVLAIPVVAAGMPRFVIYSASRGPDLDDGARSALLAAARQLEYELVIHDEVARRLALLGEQVVSREQRFQQSLREFQEQLTDAIAALADDPLRMRLESIAARMSDLDAAAIGSSESPLSPREHQVLSLVALGSTYPEVATHLALRPETVKSYMRSAMAKLGADNRHRAVVEAQRRHLL